MSRHHRPCNHISCHLTECRDWRKNKPPTHKTLRNNTWCFKPLNRMKRKRKRRRSRRRRKGIYSVERERAIKVWAGIEGTWKGTMRYRGGKALAEGHTANRRFEPLSVVPVLVLGTTRKRTSIPSHGLLSKQELKSMNPDCHRYVRFPLLCPLVCWNPPSASSVGVLSKYTFSLCVSCYGLIPMHLGHCMLCLLLLLLLIPARVNFVHWLFLLLF